MFLFASPRALPGTPFRLLNIPVALPFVLSAAELIVPATAASSTTSSVIFLAFSAACFFIKSSVNCPPTLNPGTNPGTIPPSAYLPTLFTGLAAIPLAASCLESICGVGGGVPTP